MEPPYDGGYGFLMCRQLPARIDYGTADKLVNVGVYSFAAITQVLRPAESVANSVASISISAQRQKIRTYAMNVERFDAFLHRLERTEVALPSDLGGCSSSEIAEIEARYGLSLPATYRRFLEVMGYRSGWLFAAEQVLVHYETILTLTEELRDSLSLEDPELGAKIPPDAIFVLTTGDDVDFFIRCGEAEDPPVYALNSVERNIEVAYSSVTEWLEGACEYAEEALAEGYFNDMAKDEVSPPRKARPPVEPLPYALICPGCKERLVFREPSSEHTRCHDYGFLYNDAGTSTLVWETFDPSYEAMCGTEKPWGLSPEQQAAFEARLKPAPAGGRWRFANYPRCPLCHAAIGCPVTKSDLLLVYDGSLVLNEPGSGKGLSEALTEKAATPIAAPKDRWTPGKHVVSCPACTVEIPFDAPPSTEDARLKNLAFLYNDAGTLTLVWATTDPAYRSMFGDRKPWEFSPEQQKAFEARLKPAPAGGQWRFSNPARCPSCGEAVSPPMTQCDLCLIYKGSLLLQHWISGSSLNGALKL